MHTIFVTEDGDVYGCGQSDDGRTFTGKGQPVKAPRKALPLGGRASFVRCGCFHSVALVDIRRPVHPGLLFFGLLVGNLRSPRLLRITPELTIDVALGSVTGAGFLTGDRVIAAGEHGRVVGVMGDRICVKTDGGVGLFKRAAITFESRDGGVPRSFTTRSGVQLIVDASPRLCRAFGFAPDDTVSHRMLGKGAVAGFANGTIWFVFDALERRICRCKETSLAAIHSIITIIATSRTIRKIVCSDNVEYPIEPCEPFNVKSDASFGEAIGELGAYFCVADYFDKKFRLVERRLCHRIEDFHEFRRFDYVIAPGVAGTIVDCSPRCVLVLSDERLLRSEPPVCVEDGLELLFRVVGRGRRREFEVGACVFGGGDAMPGDLWAVRDGYVRIVGLREGKVVCSRKLAFGDDAVVEEFERVRSGAILISRRVLPSTRICKLCTGGSIEVSVYAPSFAGLGFLPGDEITLGGKRYVVFGSKGGYLWIRQIGGQGVAFWNPRITGGQERAELVSRPAADWTVFFE
jgi:hypothetical protein